VLEMPSTPEDLIGTVEQPLPASSPVRFEQEVLDAYTTLMHGAARERHAFEQAVRIYQAHNPGLPNDAARRAVANIICHKP
jgi:hypothetical protein